MFPSRHRHERLADQICAEVAEMIAGELNDPRIGLATVTRLDLSPDFHHARVLVSVLGDDEKQRKTLEGLVHAAGYVRREVTRRLRMRRVPEFVFVLDRAAEAEMRVDGLLRKLKEQT